MTVGISLMLTALISLNTFISVKGSVLGQRSVNNAYFAEQSLQHAEMGLKKAQDNIKQYLASHPEVKSFADIPASHTTLNVPNKYSTSISGNQLISTGYVNGIGLRKVALFLEIASGAGGVAAMNALGSVDFGGSTSATNVTAGKIIIGNVPSENANPNSTEFKMALLDQNGKILKDTAGNPIYRSMTSDEFFMYYFSGLCPVAKAAYDKGDLTKAAECKPEAKTNVAANPKGYICNGDCSSKAEDNKITTAYNAGKRIFWLENGGIDHKAAFGTLTDPVLILVMNIPDSSKSAKINGGSTIYGVLYVDIISTKTFIGCSCSVDAVITSITVSDILVNDLTKPIYVLVLIGGTKCTTNGGCKDSLGLIIPKNAMYLTLYQQKIQSSNKIPQYGKFSNFVLNLPSALGCTINACVANITSALTVCTGGLLVGDIGKCSFEAKAVSGRNNAPIEVEEVGTWEAGGTGKSTVQGAVITSGNYSGTGNATYIQNRTVVGNIITGGIGGTGFNSSPATLTASSWSDMLY